jgi:RHS repeat-associated protein
LPSFGAASLQTQPLNILAGYTNNGDLASLGNGAQRYAFTYDLENNLRSATSSINTSQQEFVYTTDGMNRRIAKTWVDPTTTVKEGLLYDEQGRVVAELSGTGTPLTVRSTFVYGLKQNVPDYMIQNGKPYVILSDWRGSVRQVVDPSTTPVTVIETIDYDEWGDVTSLVDTTCPTGGACLNFQPFGFAGGIYEPITGLVRFGARDYNPQLRRWTQKDPIRFDGGQENIYTYASNDPVNFSDPLGLQVSPAQQMQIWAALLN